MVVLVSDSNDSDEFEWDEDRDDEARVSSSPALRNSDVPGPSTLVWQDAGGRANGAAPSASSVGKFVGMGFPKEMVLKGIKEIGDRDPNALVELLLTYKALGDFPPVGNCSTSSRCIPQSVEDNDDDDLTSEDWDESDAAAERDHIPISDGSGYEDFLQEMSQMDKKIKYLVSMGFPENEANMAITRCGSDAAISVLVDLIYASEYVPLRLPNPMVGFGLPGERLQLVTRRLPALAIGPPFFYFENILYDIEPEFVDSKFFCAAIRQRGYIHNLPIEGRFPILPLPPKTILEAFPQFKKWWPSCDSREYAKLAERIHRALSKSGNPPSQGDQEYVMRECRKWNLPNEMELLLGYPADHTGQVAKMERYKSLGNSFQVDTVAYHLSVLKEKFPGGINVSSLFTGIGGAEVALHRLGIRLRAVVSVEISEVSRSISKGWCDQTQTGTLIEIYEVQSLTDDRIESFIRRLGRFDLVIGGSPCNNLSGSNRHHRVGLDGAQSALFYDYVRILKSVKSTMARM
ncbi:hypothetical protein BRADI_1g11420v3 [Brachypodium distachyon]|uniref:DNA (cytosine-5-)-methyltransferase n=1 Tax=Brachypodium distachyon TaxID=15368 RepID=A0A0Q3GS02_BRADI|nr:hypothetical protein BRADI_1g11420v3 [Brachypodium distachyon]